MIFDTPEKIEGFRILATLHGLKMEIEMPAKFPWATPQSLPTRGRALASAKRILAKYNVPGPAPTGQYRTRKQCLVGMQLLCRDLGLIKEES